MIKNKDKIFLAVIFLCLINAGFQSSEKKEAPAINFYGEVKTSNQTEQAEEITIGGLYENIPLYGIPAAAETSPTTNISHIRLDDIRTIRHKMGKESIKEFQKRDYVEIELEFKNGKKQSYLIERARKIYYEVPFSDPKIVPLEKELAPEALEHIIIKGHRQKARTTTVEPEQKSAAREAVCMQAKKNLNELTHVTEKTELREESKGFLNKIDEAVNYLCS